MKETSWGNDNYQLRLFFSFGSSWNLVIDRFHLLRARIASLIQIMCKFHKVATLSGVCQYIEGDEKDGWPNGRYDHVVEQRNTTACSFGLSYFCHLRRAPKKKLALLPAPFFRLFLGWLNLGQTRWAYCYKIYLYADLYE